MTDIAMYTITFAAGLILGVVFFGGLWFTVKKTLNSKTPALWFLLSFLLRTGIVLAGFYFISGADWKKLLLCVFGFIIARYIIAYLSRSAASNTLKNQGGEI